MNARTLEKRERRFRRRMAVGLFGLVVLSALGYTEFRRPGHGLFMSRSSAHADVKADSVTAYEPPSYVSYSYSSPSPSYSNDSTTAPEPSTLLLLAPALLLLTARRHK